MDIICTLKREGGSEVSFDGENGEPEVIYNFVPNKHGHHVASVKNKAHRKRLMGIGGYDVYDPEDYADEDDEQDDDADKTGEQSGDQNVQSPSEPVSQAPISQGTDISSSQDGQDTGEQAEPEDANGSATSEEEAETSDGGDELTDEEIVDGEKTAVPYEDMDKDQLMDIYEKSYGRKANPNTKSETLIERIIEAQQG